jgi:cell wall-associated NlpC family hydrolase
MNDLKREAIVKTALSLIGTPYRLRGVTTKGFDCCGFVMYVYARNHISLPHSAHEQFNAGKKIDLIDVRKGDLLFYRIAGNMVSHVVLYIGDGRFVHSPVPGARVRIESVDGAYWKRYYAGAATFIE